jgi:hypothetical protein
VNVFTGEKGFDCSPFCSVFLSFDGLWRWWIFNDFLFILFFGRNGWKGFAGIAGK